MGLSNYLPSSRISQSGVCTSSTRPASPYEGQVIYETDTNRVLVWNASAWVSPNSQTTNPTGLELVTGVGCSAGGTASNGVVTIGSAVSSVTVTDAFSADYDSYLIVVSGGTGSTIEGISLRLGAKTTNYWLQLLYASWNTTAAAFGTKTATSFSYCGNITPNGAFAEIFVNNPYLAKDTMIRSNWQSNNDAGYQVGRTNDTTSYTAFTLLFAGGATMTGGTIRVYGYRN